MKLHLGWVGGDPPRVVREAVERASSWPGADVTLHVGEDLVPGHRLAAMEARGVTPHMRSDIQRHAILERFGGLWLDADVVLIQDPAAWTAGWDRYTAVRLVGSGGPVGTDLIYVPAGWPGWPAVNAYIDARLADGRRLGTLDLASTMIQKLSRVYPELFHILPPGDRFPFDQRSYTSASVVARGFNPSSATPRAARPGLGDMVAAGLDAIGVTQDRVQSVATRVGIRDCGCKRRQQRLNELGRRIGIG